MADSSLPSILKHYPTVFAVGSSYRISVYTQKEAFFSVKVGNTEYSDHSNGILRSKDPVHSVTVPMKELNFYKEYTVCIRPVIKRLPYFTKTASPVSIKIPFKPVEKLEGIKIYHLSDTHGHDKYSAMAGGYFGDELDLLVLNGDIIDHSGDVKNFEIIYKLCSDITAGQRPCVFSRGNHDLRGSAAEELEKYTPTDGGKSYFTFRLGVLWGMVLDCGEDKPDDHEEYGHSISCHEFRLEEEKFIDKVIENAADEYAAPGVKYRVIISHNPFTYLHVPPFDIEQPLYRSWIWKLRREVKPQLLISGHLHQTAVVFKGEELDNFEYMCPVVIGSKYIRDAKNNVTDFIGCGIALYSNYAAVDFTDSERKCVERRSVNIIK